MDTIGLLSPRLSVAHGVHLREDQCELLAERGVIVVGQHLVQLPPPLGHRAGRPVPPAPACGSGRGSTPQPMDDDDDMLREMRLVWLNHRGFGMEDVLGRDRLARRRCTIDGPAGRGSARTAADEIAVGEPADLLVLDLAAMSTDIALPGRGPAHRHPTPARRATSGASWWQGAPCVADGRCVTVDLPALEAGLIAEARAKWQGRRRSRRRDDRRMSAATTAAAATSGSRSWRRETGVGPAGPCISGERMQRAFPRVAAG